MPVKQVGRDQWRAAYPRAIITLDTPVKRVFCNYTGAHLCPSQATCEEACRYAQRRDMGKYLMDTRYNFFVCTDDRVYEGRGWEGQPKLPKNYSQYEHVSIYIGLIGSYEMCNFTKMYLVDLMQEFIKDSVRAGYILPDYRETWTTLI